MSKEAIRDLELNVPFKKKNLGNIIAEIFKRFPYNGKLLLLGPLERLGLPSFNPCWFDSGDCRYSGR